MSGSLREAKVKSSTTTFPVYETGPQDDLPPLPNNLNASSTPFNESKEKQKLGHRRIDRQGEVSYKKVPTNALMGAVQLGITNSIGSLANKPERDILMSDFQEILSVVFPSEGSIQTPSHQYNDFRFKTYAPIAFRYFREMFNIKPADFLRSLCAQPLRELSNPGASGSVFYVSSDDKFIIKTVQYKEAEFLRELLPGYYMNICQNPKTFLPKFFGLFCYQSLGKNIRLLVMNNLLPQTITLHDKFDLKGSTYKRYASKAEKAKKSPTLKDLDFNEIYPDGILLDQAVYDSVIKILERDCLVLRSFQIMDYSLLLAVHNLDRATLEEFEAEVNEGHEGEGSYNPQDTISSHTSLLRLEKWKRIQSQFNSSLSSAEQGIPAMNSKGEHLLLFMGIIDILQRYKLIKKLEHTWKSILHDGDSISVHRPDFYKNRFQKYIFHTCFKRSETGPPTMKSSHKFRSLVQSYLAMRQSPITRSNRSIPTSSFAIDEKEEDEVDSKKLSIDHAPSLYPTRSSLSNRARKVERLFASSSAEPSDVPLRFNNTESFVQ
uniref:PIPK domain-containing protein n=1 Tax=Strongyloides stercoralis TaxID=6248 RepID=A0A0K0DX40_STRER